MRLVGRRINRYLSVAKDDDPVSALEVITQVMGNDNDARSIASEIVKPGDDLSASEPVQPGERLVEDKVVWLHRERAGDRNPGLLAAGKFVDTLVATPVKIDSRKRGVDASVNLRARKPKILGAERHVRRDRRGDEAVPGILKRHSDGCSGGDGVFARFDAVYPHCPLVGGQEGIEMTHEGRLPGAVRTCEDDVLARSDAERDTIERRGLAVAVDELFDLDHGVRRL